MSDEEEKVEGELNPDLLEAGLEDEPVIDGEEELEDGDISLEKAADEEEEEGAISDRFDDIDLI